MSVQERPVDNFTEENLLIGLPYVEFAPALAGGGFGPFRNLGIVENASLEKAVELADLNSAHSGVDQLVRRIVRKVDNTFQVGIFNHDDENMRLAFAAAAITLVSGGVSVVTDDEFTVDSANPFEAFNDLTNARVTTEPLTDLTCKTITDEAVGTGQGGTFGETQGDFALDFAVSLVADITSLTIGGVDRTADLVSGAAPLATEIGVIIGPGATSGELTFPSGEAPAAGAAIVATYTPSFSFTGGTDYLLDVLDGRIRMLGTGKVRANQFLLADYSYNATARSEIDPFTQLVFEGRARIRQLTDVGRNIIWNIPSVSVRITDDAFEFSREEFSVLSLAMELLDDGSSKPFGTMELYAETP